MTSVKFQEQQQLWRDKIEQHPLVMAATLNNQRVSE